MIHIWIALWMVFTSNVLYVGVTDKVGVHCIPDSTYSYLFVQEDTPIDVWMHELAHVADCADDGVLNGSPPITRVVNVITPAWARQHCDSNATERYACDIQFGYEWEEMLR